MENAVTPSSMPVDTKDSLALSGDEFGYPRVETEGPNKYFLKVKLRGELMKREYHAIWEDEVDTNATTEIPPWRINALKYFYEIGKPEIVLSFLNKNVDLVSILLDAHEYLENHFGEQADFLLDLFPSIENEVIEHLIVGIKSEAEMPALFNALDKFDEYWWLITSRSLRGRLIFKLAF